MADAEGVADAGFKIGVARAADVCGPRPGEVGLKLESVGKFMFKAGLERAVARSPAVLDLNDPSECGVEAKAAVPALTAS